MTTERGTWGNPGTGPQHHPVQGWLHQGLQRLRGDLQLGTVDEATLDLLSRAIDELSPMAGLFLGPHRQEVRLLVLSGGLRATSDGAALLPSDLLREQGFPDLSGLPEALETIDVALGAGFRSRAAAKVAGLYVIIDPELTGGRDPEWVAEQALLGSRVDGSLLQDVSKIVSEELDPDSDIHASAAYRKEVGGVIARRTLEAAINRVSGDDTA